MSSRLVLLVAVAAASCQAGCQDREVVGSAFVKSVAVMAASGAFITVTADEDPVLAGMWLRIPPGSLPHDLVVTIARGGQDIAGATTQPLGPVAIVGPEGTELSLRTTRLGLPVTPGTMSERQFIAVRDPDGRRSTVAATTGPDAAAEVYIDRFAAFQVVRLRSGVAAPDGGLPLPPPPPPQDAR